MTKYIRVMLCSAIVHGHAVYVTSWHVLDNVGQIVFSSLLSVVAILISRAYGLLRWMIRVDDVMFFWFSDEHRMDVRRSDMACSPGP